MAVPSAPTVSGVKNTYQPTDTIDLTWFTTPDVTSCAVKIYEQTGYGMGTLVVDTTATSTLSPWNYKEWEWTDTVSNFAADGKQYLYEITATNASGTSSPASGVFRVYAAPTVTLSPPDSTIINDLPLEITWIVSSSTGVSNQYLHIADHSDPTSVLYDSRWPMGITPDTRAVLLYANDLSGIRDGKSYDIELGVTDGVGQTTVTTHTISTSWAETGSPTIEEVEPDQDSMAVTVTVHAVPGTSTTVWRVVNGERLEIGSGTDLFELVDPLPPLGADYTYEAMSTDDQTGVASIVVSKAARINSSSWVFNFGAHAEEFVMLRYNPSASYSIEHGGALYHFADGGAGGGFPVYYSTTDRDESGSISWQTADWQRVNKLRELSLAHPIGWIRDPYGHRWRAHIMPSMSHERTRVRKVSIDWDKVRWEEP